MTPEDDGDAALAGRPSVGGDDSTWKPAREIARSLPKAPHGLQTVHVKGMGPAPLADHGKQEQWIERATSTMDDQIERIDSQVRQDAANIQAIAQSHQSAEAELDFATQTLRSLPGHGGK